MLSRLLRWYYKNSFNAKYVLQLENSYEKVCESYAELFNQNQSDLIALFMIKSIKLGEKRQVENYHVLKCNYEINGYVMKELRFNGNNRIKEFLVKIYKDDEEYVFEGRHDYWTYCEDGRYVDFSHHPKNNIYRESLEKISEMFLK